MLSKSMEAFVIINTKKNGVVIQMKNRPLWFRIISIIVAAIAITNLFTHSSLFRTLTMLGLAVVMISFGTFELSKNRMMAFMFFGVAILQIFTMIKTIYVIPTK